MPQKLHSRRYLTLLLALVASVFFMATVQKAQGAPPVDELIWSGERCDDGIAAADLTALGNGRWATVVVQISFDGGDSFRSLSDIYSPWRIEHGEASAMAWSGDVTFRAADAKNNGTLIGPWVQSEAIVCP